MSQDIMKKKKILFSANQWNSLWQRDDSRGFHVTTVTLCAPTRNSCGLHDMLSIFHPLIIWSDAFLFRFGGEINRMWARYGRLPPSLPWGGWCWGASWGTPGAAQSCRGKPRRRNRNPAGRARRSATQRGCPAGRKRWNINFWECCSTKTADKYRVVSDEFLPYWVA